MNSYSPGIVTTKALFYRVTTTIPPGKIPADPTTVKLDITPPGGELTTYVYGVDPEIVRGGEGDYTMEVECTEDYLGVYNYRWYSSGAGAASKRGSFAVEI